MALHAFDGLRSTMAEDTFLDPVDPQTALAFFASKAMELPSQPTVVRDYFLGA